ncbi:unnamed protein product [Vitrella brassicaformis CCMP3155]|uniref:Uncharacterized protein n=1 Tax=Vitrella brassicaformis (strain CCMP3155) TaxID=1169540 RepID=A0A0G4GYQ3_VITBC|nr:unnamed protein product [Vitrella brassicaformis CCMP3155]|eukprot:CEM36323.1 unnamed protein product [Vitrella brassicaformis CCMP3155]
MAARHHSLVDFPANALRTRLTQSLHRKLLADGSRLDTVLVFDAQTVSESRVLLPAVWLVEEQTWDEIADILRLAAHCGRCTLPVRLTADDINRHANKTEYASLPRVLAQLMVVGLHVDFGDGSRLELFRHGHEVRAINDEPGFRLTRNPHLPPGHLYEQHRLQDDPPVDSAIFYSGSAWTGPFVNNTYASSSSFAKSLTIDHFYLTHQINHTSISLNRGVCGGRLDDLLIQSPHTPVAGCSTTFSKTDGHVRELLLTNSSHNFVAWIYIQDFPRNRVDVIVRTTEAAVCEGGAFKDRFPVTTQLARAVLRAVISAMLFDQ